MTRKYTLYTDRSPLTTGEFRSTIAIFIVAAAVVWFAIKYEFSALSAVLLGLCTFSIVIGMVQSAFHEKTTGNNP